MQLKVGKYLLKDRPQKMSDYQLATRVANIYDAWLSNFLAIYVVQKCTSNKRIFLIIIIIIIIMIIIIFFVWFGILVSFQASVRLQVE